MDKSTDARNSCDQPMNSPTCYPQRADDISTWDQIIGNFTSDSPLGSPGFELPTDEQVLENQMMGTSTFDLLNDDPTSDLPLEDPTSDLPLEDPTSDLPLEDPNSDLPLDDPISDLPLENPTSDLPLEDPTSDLPLEDPTSDLPLEDPNSDPPLDCPTSDQPIALSPNNMAQEATWYMNNMLLDEVEPESENSSADESEPTVAFTSDRIPSSSIATLPPSQSYDDISSGYSTVGSSPDSDWLSELVSPSVVPTHTFRYFDQTGSSCYLTSGGSVVSNANMTTYPNPNPAMVGSSYGNSSTSSSPDPSWVSYHEPSQMTVNNNHLYQPQPYTPNYSTISGDMVSNLGSSYQIPNQAMVGINNLYPSVPLVGAMPSQPLTFQFQALPTAHKQVQLGKRQHQDSEAPGPSTAKRLKNNSPTGEGRKECYVCHKTFTDNHALNVHYRTHTGERPYPCLICRKPFKQFAHLQKHEESQRHIAIANASQNGGNGNKK